MRFPSSKILSDGSDFYAYPHSFHIAQESLWFNNLAHQSLSWSIDVAVEVPRKRGSQWY
jgi:hypothetical protein